MYNYIIEVMHMDIIIPVSEARGKLATLVKRMKKEDRHVILTKNGRPSAVMITEDEMETLEIMADKSLLKSIARGIEDAQKGRLYTHGEIFKHV
jgi:prevent-host-death family protein